MATFHNNTISVSPASTIILPPIRTVFMTTFDFSNLKSINTSSPKQSKNFIKKSQMISFPPSLVHKITHLSKKGRNPYLPKNLSPDSLSSLSPISERNQQPAYHIRRYPRFKKKIRYVSQPRSKFCDSSLQITENDDEFRESVIQL